MKTTAGDGCSVSTSAKHRMLLEYNQRRKKKYDHYMFKKTQQMDNEKITQNVKDDDLDSIDLECKALYKKLADNHYNKDV